MDPSIRPIDISSSALLTAAYAPATLAKYKREVSEFLAWCKAQGTVSRDADGLDMALLAYFEHLHKLGYGHGKGAATLSGLQALYRKQRFPLEYAHLALRGCAAVMSLFRAHMSTVPKGALVFDTSRADVYSAWRGVVAGLGLPSSYTTHSLRHGGACQMVMAGAGIE